MRFEEIGEMGRDLEDRKDAPLLPEDHFPTYSGSDGDVWINLRPGFSKNSL